MRKLNVSTLVTLDGVVQDPGGFGETPQGGWAGPYFNEEAQRFALEHLLESDYFLCGRITYERFVKRFTPGTASDPYGQRIAGIPKLVVSTTLDQPPADDVRLINGDVATEISKIKQQPGKDITMYGSVRLMQTLMRNDLIDRYYILVHPLVLGSGKRLFPEGGATATLHLVDSRRLRSGVEILTYEPVA